MNQTRNSLRYEGMCDILDIVQLPEILFSIHDIEAGSSAAVFILVMLLY